MEYYTAIRALYGRNHINNNILMDMPIFCPPRPSNNFNLGYQFTLLNYKNVINFFVLRYLSFLLSIQFSLETKYFFCYNFALYAWFSYQCNIKHNVVVRKKNRKKI